ncbi:MAG: hypothetical protein MR469_02235 [Campylobacter sp.]|uniref:hypothetical protein n=1 Tax=Campylobacter sp. TaxID=205 RepID=UPI002AA9173C|nr:hypothetical protein [Campylobacter sp.]MCI6694443.1 hypothetical protein [Campylobacter sp.]MCI6819358.1 hypothetical protein [Campylobacter sp.]MCI7463707.1 hypothetical protein [Campylobacter sp.]
MCLFFVLFAYLYAYVPFGVLNLSKRLSVKISFLVFYAIFTLLIAFVWLDIVVVSPIVILSILILKRKGYFTNFTKVRVAMAGACLLVYAWQFEVPQTIVSYTASKALKTKVMKEVFIENIDENATFLSATKTLLDCEDKNIACPFFSFKYPIYDIKALTDGKVRIDGKEKLVGRIYGIAYSTSTLTRLTGFDYIKRLRYFTNISK